MCPVWILHPVTSCLVRGAVRLHPAGQLRRVQHHLLLGLRQQVPVRRPGLHIPGGPDQQGHPAHRLAVHPGEVSHLQHWALSGAATMLTLLFPPADFQQLPLARPPHQTEELPHALVSGQQAAEPEAVCPPAGDPQPSDVPRLRGLLHGPQATPTGWQLLQHQTGPSGRDSLTSKRRVNDPHPFFFKLFFDPPGTCRSPGPRVTSTTTTSSSQF